MCVCVCVCVCVASYSFRVVVFGSVFPLALYRRHPRGLYVVVTILTPDVAGPESDPPMFRPSPKRVGSTRSSETSHQTSRIVAEIKTKAHGLIVLGSGVASGNNCGISLSVPRFAKSICSDLMLSGAAGSICCCGKTPELSNDEEDVSQLMLEI